MQSFCTQFNMLAQHKLFIQTVTKFKNMFYFAGENEKGILLKIIEIA